mgnify:CR=1 FL=1|tara:strand:+ start:323 stop:1657 length:1335 start_codon:yes stop_codon:yes gene_type:complete
MGLLDGQTQQSYYQGNDHGDYQFTSLDDIINQFMAVYVGEDKIIPKAKRMDVAFHAQRALAELSFDTLKSCKAQEITLPPSLQMTLPQDYVNYTKVSWVDSAGIKHLLYPTSKTSNPFPTNQDSNNDYVFSEDGGLISTTNLIANGGFDDDTGWTVDAAAWTIGDITITSTSAPTSVTHNNSAQGNAAAGYMSITAPDIIEGRTYRITYDIVYASTGTTPQFILANHTTIASTLSSTTANNNVNLIGETATGTYSVDWLQGPTNTGIIKLWNSASFDGIIDNIKVVRVSDSNSETSATWSNYKSGTPSENQDDYQDGTYWPMEGSRYGLDPQHAQANGSFYIDCVSGKIHFSSNISGKTVILDYISDSLGTDGEMQVHKFAEEAMYKWISHAIMAGRANVPEYQVNRFKKERFAAIRTAKLRLSNLKLEELTQILRGKSKQIKH